MKRRLTAIVITAIMLLTMAVLPVSAAYGIPEYTPGDLLSMPWLWNWGGAQTPAPGTPHGPDGLNMPGLADTLTVALAVYSEGLGTINEDKVPVKQIYEYVKLSDLKNVVTVNKGFTIDGWYLDKYATKPVDFPYEIRTPAVTLYVRIVDDGSKKYDPYLIYDAEQMEYVREHPDKYYKLMDSITLRDWEPIGIYDSDKPSKAFTGNFDGNGHNIIIKSFDSMRDIKAGSDGVRDVGLFGYIGPGGKVYDLTVKTDGISIVTDRKISLGLIAGRSAGIITECTVLGNVSLKTSAASTKDEEGNHVGGVVGYLGEEGIISLVGYTGNVSAEYTGSNTTAHICAGGLAGLSGGSITDSSSTGNKNAKGFNNVFAGGIKAHDVEDTDTITDNCTSIGDVTADGTGGNIYAGGISAFVAYSFIDVIITDSSSTGDITANGGADYVFAGGISGSAACSIENCSSSGDITANGDDNDAVYAGGILGYALSTECVINNCVSQGAVSSVGDDIVNAGGIAGSTENEITESTSTGDISALGTGKEIYAGGITGKAGIYYTNGIVDCISTGDVTAISTNNVAGVHVSAGGIAAISSMPIINSISTGDIEASSEEAAVHAGGIVGYTFSNLKNNTSIGNVKASSEASSSTDSYVYAGGIAGWTCGDTENSSSVGNISAYGKNDFVFAGGVIGNLNDGDVTNTYSRGSVEAEGNINVHAAGIVGYMQNSTSTVSYSYSQSYNNGGITATGVTAVTAGGIIGYAEGTIENCVAFDGPIVSSQYVGRVIGLESATSPTLNNNYGRKNARLTGGNFGGTVIYASQRIEDKNVTGTLTNQHGKNINEVQFATQSWWDTTPGVFSAFWGTVWTWNSSDSVPELLI